MLAENPAVVAMALWVVVVLVGGGGGEERGSLGGVGESAALSTADLEMVALALAAPLPPAAAVFEEDAESSAVGGLWRGVPGKAISPLATLSANESTAAFGVRRKESPPPPLGEEPRRLGDPP